MAEPDAELPRYLYKLIPASEAPPDPLPEVLPLSELDEKSGFIHLSTATQVPGTLRHFFEGDKTMYILKIPFEPLKDKIRWESPDKKVCGPRPGEGLFPHLYSEKLGKDEVECAVRLEKGDASWDTTMNEAKSDWLVY